MPKYHALLSASASRRWLNCTPSAVLESHEPDTSSPFAEEGTRAHALAEKKLKAWIKSNRKTHFKADDGEMQECTDGYRDYVIEIFNDEKKKTPDAELRIEQKLDFSRWVPDGFGTGDAVIIGDDTLHIIDFKYGKGVKVSAEDNSQMLLYAAGALDVFGALYDFDKITTHIYQPRIGNVSESTITVSALEEWLDTTVKPKADLASKGDGDPRPGDWCRFCKVRAKCKARADFDIEAVKSSGFDTDPNLLDKEDIESILPMLDELQSWIKDLSQYALDQALQGVHYKGFKVVEGRSNRKVVDDNGLIDALHKMGYEDDVIMTKPKLQTITALEKAVGKKMFTGIAMPYIDKPKGKPTLVPESDKRPEYSSAEEDFADDLK